VSGHVGPGWQPPPEDPYVRLTDEGLLAEAIDARNAERELRQQAAEMATFAGTMRNLAEARRGVTVRSGSGRGYQGVLVAVAIDHIVVQAGDARTVYIALEQVTAIQVDPSVKVGLAAGERDAAQDRTLDEVLANVVGGRPTVVIVTRGDGEANRGRLIGVGEDVVSLRLDGTGGVRYLPATALSEVVIE
jgi:hypothetical protein